ncbi:MAG: hypothetical protein ACLR6J_03905 [Parabacteroides merdae]
MTIAARTRKSEKRYGTRPIRCTKMIVYALFPTEEAKGKQERMCAVALENFFQEFGDDLHRLIFGIEEKAYKNRIPVSKPEFLIGTFRRCGWMEVFGDVRPRYLIGFMSETFDPGPGGVSATDHLSCDKCGMWRPIEACLQEFFRNLYRK